MSDRTTQVLLGILILSAGLAWQQGGPQLALLGLLEGGRSLLRMAPLISCAFLIAGLCQVLLKGEKITRWMGSESGWKGLLLGSLGGALIPGGPYVYLPIAITMMRGGAGLGVLVAFLSAKNLWPFVRLPLEFALLGPRLTLARLTTNLLLPPLLGYLAQLLYGRHTDRFLKDIRL